MDQASKARREGSVRAPGISSCPRTPHPWEEEQGRPLLEIPQARRDHGGPVI